MLPPNATHLFQPLDRAVFAPMKMSWRRELSKRVTCDKYAKGIFSTALRKAIQIMFSKFSRKFEKWLQNMWVVSLRQK